MTPTFRRWRSLRAYEHALAKHDKEHPATIAAYTRACVAWGEDRVRPTLAMHADASGVAARVRLRARGVAGFCNRHCRKRNATQALVK